MTEPIDFETDYIRKICGPNDSNISFIENLTKCRVKAVANRIYIEGSPAEQNFAVDLLNNLMKLADTSDSITTQDILLEYRALTSNADEGLMNEQILTVGTKTIKAKNSIQAEYIKGMQNSQVVFAVGPAGTGKTFLATNYCLSQLFSGKKNKILITRPVVEAGENLGFLPGDLSQKLNPYLKPIYDSMEAVVSPSTVKRLEENGQLEISPLAYMRGRSINNSCIILDEAQNTTKSQMKMFLTRLGEDSCAIITGDITQTDLPENQTSGLTDAIKRLKDVEGVSIFNFTAKETVRSRIVQRIINAYEK